MPQFKRLYARIGRPSISPEELLRALLLRAFYVVGSERQLMEQLDYTLLFRWFVGLAMDAPVWDASTFPKDRDPLLEGDVALALLAAVVAQPPARGVTPHIARNDHETQTGRHRRSTIDGRTTRHPGYAVSQVVRKRVEEVFGWIKSTAGLRQTRHRGLDRLGWTFTLAAAAHNLVRLPALLRPAT